MPKLDFITLFDPSANAGRGRHEIITEAEAAEYEAEYLRNWEIEYRAYDMSTKQQAHDAVFSYGLQRDAMGGWNQNSYSILFDQAFLLTHATAASCGGEPVTLTRDNLIEIDPDGVIARKFAFEVQRPIDRAKLKKKKRDSPDTATVSTKPKE